MGSEKRFGYEWQKYKLITPEHESQFLELIKPFDREIFKNKKFLDAGCGMGCNSYWVLRYGAEKVVCFDFDRRSVEAARENLKSFENCQVQFENIYNIPWLNEFDIVFSRGVIHHLENPELAVENLIKAAKPGALILIWVYGYEGNEWIVKFVNPIRIHFTSKLPPRLLNFISYFLSFPLWAFVRIFPQRSPYFKQISKFRFSHLHSIVFDQLLPILANYYKKEEAYQLLAGQNLKNVGISRINENSWTVYGYK